MTPLSMTSLIVPVMPGIVTELTDAPGGTSTIVGMRWPVTRTTVTECSCAEAGIAATPRPTVAAMSAIMPFRRFILSTRPPARLTAHPARASPANTDAPGLAPHATEWHMPLQLEND